MLTKPKPPTGKGVSYYPACKPVLGNDDNPVVLNIIATDIYIQIVYF